MPSIAITGATGFVGSNVAAVLSARGFDVIALTRREPSISLPWDYAVVDTYDVEAVAQAAQGTQAIVHTAIANDFQRLEPSEAYRAYPGLTQSITRAAMSVGAKPVYISTDWVMDGTGHRVTEDSIGQPVNTYGYLKALGEQVIRDLSPGVGAICRIGGVMGRNRLIEGAPRSQDVGFGYFVSSLVDTVRSGREFGVFSGPGVNLTATPSLAAEIGATIGRIVDRNAWGVFHVVSDDAIDRWDLAMLTAEVFGLDTGLITQVEPGPGDRFDQPVPTDTSLDNTRVKTELGIGPVSVRDMLEHLKAEEDGALHPVTTSL